jgi:vanillate/3-O-methylgallate O-demethylase
VASDESLEDALRRVGDPVRLLRDAMARPYTFPVTPEFSNWRSEQRAWLETCVLFDQSHHMADLFVRGPDAVRVFADLGVNSFERFRPGMAKQFVATNPDGFVIGDGILFYLDEEELDFVGAHPAIVDWVHYRCETGQYRVSVERDENSYDREGPPMLYRYELQGPRALAVVERLIGGPVPEVPFFHLTQLRIGGRPVRALRHGMAGQPGFELFGPWAEGEEVLARILEAGGDLGLVRAGARAYSSANLESGWVPSPLPAIFTGEELRPFREWRRAARMGSLGGSYLRDRIEDYYLTPFDLGYGRLVAFDHEFVGRRALEGLQGQAAKEKVTLVWDPGDVAAVFRSQMEDDLPAKYLEWPKSRYALFQYDEVQADGRPVGVSLDCGYVASVRRMLSLAVVDRDVARPGQEVEVLWGEEPNSAKPQVEPHRQVRIRARVAPAPYSEVARGAYRSASTSELRRAG